MKIVSTQWDAILDSLYWTAFENFAKTIETVAKSIETKWNEIKLDPFEIRNPVQLILFNGFFRIKVVFLLTMN